MITFVYESFNESLNTSNPNNWPKDWIIDGVETKPYAWSDNNKEFQFDALHKLLFLDNTTLQSKIAKSTYIYKLYDKLLSDEKYFYPIFISNVDYFPLMNSKNFSFNFIDERIINDVKNNRAKIIFLFLYEGFSSIYTKDQSRDDFIILDNWCKQFNFTKDQIYIATGNFLGPEQTKNLNFTALISNEVILWNKPNLNYKLKYNPSNENYLYLSYNRRPRLHRTLLLCELIRNNLLDYGKVSYYGGWSERSVSGVIRYRSDLSDAANILDQKKPLLLDIEDLKNNNPTGIKTIEHYEQTFVSIVTETIYSENCLFLTEKIWKTLAIGHPFFLLGSKNLLKKLKELGFKTFDKWFNEDYDNYDKLDDRVSAIVNEIKRLSEFPIGKLKDIRLEMNSTIEYNKYKHFSLYRKTLDPIDEFGLLGQLNNIWKNF